MPLIRYTVAILFAFGLFSVGVLGGVGVAQAQEETPQEADAMVSNTSKWYFHVHLGGHSQNIGNRDDADGGGGIGARVGYGISSLVTLYLGLDVAGLDTENSSTRSLFGDDYGLGTFELGAQFNFRRGKRLVPYFDAALIGVGSVADEGGRDVSITGGGFGLGGGVKYFLSPEFALDGGLYLSTGGYTEQEVSGESQDIDTTFNNGRLVVGATWYPFQ